MFRKTVATANWLLAKIILLLVAAYRYLISPVLGCNCRFYPSCSEYMQIAIKTHGVWAGGWLALKRLSKCHPWHRGHGGYDPVPLLINPNRVSPPNG